MKRNRFETMDLGLKQTLLALLIASLPSRIKVLVYRLSGAQIGKRASVGFGAIILAEKFSKIYIGDYSSIRAFAVIVCGEVSIGKYSEIGFFVWIWGAGKLKIGDKCYVGPRVMINLRRNDFTMGDYAGVGPGSVVYTHGMFLPYTEGWPRTFADVVMEDYTWVPARVLILPGVRIGKMSVIGSGSVITKSIPAGTFAAGAPAKVISEVGKLMHKVDDIELKKRILEMVTDLANFYSVKAEVQELPDNSVLVTIVHKDFLKTKSHKILIANAQVFAREKILEFHREGGFVLLSSSDIPSELHKRVRTWFDLRNLKCSGISDEFGLMLWDFMRREWCVVCDVAEN